MWIVRILKFVWKGIQVWSILLAFGITGIARGILSGIVSKWACYDQLCFFVGMFLLVLVIAALLAPRLWPLLEPKGINYQKESSSKSKRSTLRKPSRLKHDNVLWEDSSIGISAYVDVEGPLCPKDYASLGVERDAKIQSNLDDRMYISDSNYH